MDIKIEALSNTQPASCPPPRPKDGLGTPVPTVDSHRENLNPISNDWEPPMISGGQARAAQSRSRPGGSDPPPDADPPATAAGGPLKYPWGPRARAHTGESGRAMLTTADVAPAEKVCMHARGGAEEHLSHHRHGISFYPPWEDAEHAALLDAEVLQCERGAKEKGVPAAAPPIYPPPDAVSDDAWELLSQPSDESMPDLVIEDGTWVCL